MGMFGRLGSRLRQAAFLGQGAYYFFTRLQDDHETTAAGFVEETARTAPTRTAVLFESRRLSYAEFDALANRIANTLAAEGCKRGDVVALVMDNRPEYLATMIGLNKLGIVTSLVNTHIAGDPLAHAIKICGPRFVLAGEEHAANVAALGETLVVPKERVLVLGEPGRPHGDAAGFRRIDDDVDGAPATRPKPTSPVKTGDPMLYMYTSGTTGLPKAAVIKNQRFLRAAFTFGRVLAKLGPDDCTYVAVPLYHATGSVAAYGSALVTGGTLALRRKFSASAFFDDCHRFGVTCFPYIGELCRYLLQAPPHPQERTHRIRVMMGAGMRPDVWVPFVERFAVPRVIEFYAATEGNVAIVNLEGRPGMLGALLPGHEVIRVDPATESIERGADGRCVRCAVGDKGMLVGRIDRINRFDGYLDPQKTQEKVLRDPLGDGHDYFNTGDLVQLHEDRYVSFADRLGDTFRWKGENVSTTEVSMLLNECPGVLESNVYGVEVPGYDGRAGMVALVVDERFSLDVFSRHVESRLPKYARPVFVRTSGTLQLTGSFKYVKTDLKKQGFDPSAVDEPLAYLGDGGARYQPLDADAYARITAGAVRL